MDSGLVGVTSQRIGLIATVGIGVALAIWAYIYCATFIYESYISGGPYFYDMALLNYLASSVSAALGAPSAYGIPSFFAIHASPIFVLFGFLSSALHLKAEQPLEMMCGVGFAAAAVSAFVVARQFLLPVGQIAAILLGAGFAVVFTLSGVMRGILGYPHFEVLYVGFAAAALFLMFQRRLRWAWLPMVLCLTTREDAGLHLACVLGAYLVLAAIEERAIPARTADLLPFLIGCLAYSFLVIVIQRLNYPDQSAFAATYSGAPPYAHLTSTLVRQRLHALLGQSLFVTLTLGATAIVILFQWRWVALTGLLAAAPWFLLNVTAKSETAGTLFLYYGFPFLVAALAPLIVCAPMPRIDKEYVDYA